MPSQNSSEVVIETHLTEMPLAGRGKVRDIYDLGDRLLIITTDRLSAFDCILPTGIPDKGAVLNTMSRFWFHMMQDVLPNHLAEADPLPAPVQVLWPALKRRSMIVQKATPFPIECVVRGYLSGSAWSEYRENQAAGRLVSGQVPCAGILLDPGLTESARLPAPMFTPATKATSGHDENIDFDEAARIIGKDKAGLLRDYSIRIYQRAVEYAASRGIIIADTKFEFGETSEGIILIDEVLTPDSSRFWDASTYNPGQAQPSFDKQFVRDYLQSLGWDKTPPAPALPEDIVERTSAKYREAYRRLVGRELEE